LKKPEPSTGEPRLLTVKQAAAYLACSIFAIRSFGWSGTIPSLKIGRKVLFDRHDLDRYVDLSKAGAR
jgi:excisionase family DNA binding protein